MNKALPDQELHPRDAASDLLPCSRPYGPTRGIPSEDCRWEVGLLDPDLLPLAKASKLLPRSTTGKSVSIQTLRRWANRGVKGERLALTFVGGRACVSRDAMQDFLKRINAARRQVLNPSPQVAASRAAAKLKKMGA